MTQIKRVTGIGGIFFDNLRDGEGGLGLDRLVPFMLDVGGALPAAYEPIVERRRSLPYGERERRFQLARRGRYVEFNLVHDRGTLFGLQTNARIESVLMSLPPVAAWEYAPEYAPGSFEAYSASSAYTRMLTTKLLPTSLASTPAAAVLVSGVLAAVA